jgi:uncharacterized membrane protein
MGTSISDSELGERLNRLERELERTAEAVSGNESRLQILERRPAPGPRQPQVLRAPVAAPMAEARPPRRGQPPVPHLDGSSISDFLGGRALAWLGALATLLGIVLLLILAISHGWIGAQARTALAGLGSASLMSAGIWLHARRGRTESTVAMVAAGTAGAFATLIVASEVYHLIPGLVALCGSLLVGGLATVLAIRWAGRAVAALGLIGGLLSPVLVAAPSDGITLAVLAAGAGCAMWVVLWRRWSWLAFSAVLVCAPQWAYWMTQGHGPAPEIVVMTVFGALGVIGAVFAQLRSREEDSLVRSAAALVLMNALIIGIAGRVALGPTAGALWLAVIGFVHVAAGLSTWTRLALHPTLRRLFVAVGVIAGDTAIGLSAHGLVLPAAWAVTAIVFAWLIRRGDHGDTDEPWLGVGLGAHIGLVLMRAVVELPSTQIEAGSQLAPLASIAILAAACLGSARIAGGGRSLWRMALDGLGLLALGFLTLGTLDGPELVAAWALEAVALLQITRRTGDPLARCGALAFLSTAALHTVALEAPPAALVSGVAGLGDAALAVGAVAFAAVRMGMLARPSDSERRILLGGAAVAGLYLASLAIITAFQPAAGTDPQALLDLGIREQGQVVLSGLWGVVGVGGLLAGLRRNIVAVRTAALALLLATVTKVFLYDLSTLTSIYRVVSFFVLGALLLAGAFLYQRLRPPPRPDLRTVHASQR